MLTVEGEYLGRGCQLRCNSYFNKQNQNLILNYPLAVNPSPLRCNEADNSQILLSTIVSLHCSVNMEELLASDFKNG